MHKNEFETAAQDSIFTRKRSLSIGSNSADLSVPLVMGILNVTPDSFYDGGSVKREYDLLKKAEKHMNEGAYFLDVGGFSTRPGAGDVSEKEEAERVIPAVKAVADHFPQAVISIDTFRAGIAGRALDAGAKIINDVSGGEADEKMIETVARARVPYIIMHMPGSPQTMQQHTDYENATRDVIRYFSHKITVLHKARICDIVIDPGFGFGKTPDQNLQLLRELEYFQLLDCPVMIGVSRKSTIQKTLGASADKALNGTSVLNTVALLNGASILRVHDVKEAVEAVKLVERIKNSNRE